MVKKYVVKLKANEDWPGKAISQALDVSIPTVDTVCAFVGHIGEQADDTNISAKNALRFVVMTTKKLLSQGLR
jgi:hypothetical protein